MNRQGRNRRGSIYLAILGAAMIVSIIGVSALVVVRVGNRSVTTGNDVAERGSTPSRASRSAC